MKLVEHAHSALRRQHALEGMCFRIEHPLVEAENVRLTEYQVETEVFGVRVSRILA